MFVFVLILVERYGFLNLFPSDVIASEVNHAPVNFFLFFGTSIYVFEGINMALVIICVFVCSFVLFKHSDFFHSQ